MQTTITILKICTERAAGHECGWPEIAALIDQFIKFAFFLASIIATFSIAYAGWLYLTNNGNSGQITKAHSILWNTILGIIFISLAWIIVQFILTTLGVTSDYSLLRGR